MLFRVILVVAVNHFLVLSLRHMPLGMATALFQSSVIFITLLSLIFLSEEGGAIPMVGGFNRAVRCIIANPFLEIYHGIFSTASERRLPFVLSLLLRQFAQG